MGSPLGRRGVAVLALLALAAVGSVAASRLGYVERVRARLWGRAPRLTPGDFPPGASAPVDDVASIPTRAVVVGLIPRGCVAPLAWAAGDEERVGLFRAAYALDLKVVVFQKEDELRRALVRGGENGGVDVAALPVSTLAMSSGTLRDAAPRTVLLLGRSRGQDVLAGLPPISRPADLAGKRIATEPRSAGHYFALWVLSRAGLTTRDVTFVPLENALEAGDALAAGRADAAAAPAGAVDQVVREKGGAVVSTSADAPHLLATVLTVRGDFAARYPDAVKRLVRGALDANLQVLKEPGPAARGLGLLAPALGEPGDVVQGCPPASLQENLAFFGLAGEAPVSYSGLFQSAAALSTKLGQAAVAVEAQDTVDLSALKYVAAAKVP